MKTKKNSFTVDYKKLDIFDEFNVENIKYPLILSSPHSGTVFPKEFLKNIQLSPEDLRESEDPFVTEIVKAASEHGIPLLSLNIHRTFIDVNRDKSEVDETMYFDKPETLKSGNIKHSRFGLGIIHRIVSQHKEIYPGQISYKEVEARFANVYDVYHKRLKQLIDKVRRKFGFCLVIDCHSMPAKICHIMNETKPVDFCIGNLFGESCPEQIVNFFKKQLEDENYRVELNRPYSGAFITSNYSQPCKKQFTMHFEINRSLYMDEPVYKKIDIFQSVSSNICNSLVSLGNFLLDFK